MREVVATFDVKIENLFELFGFVLGRVTIGKWQPAYVLATPWGAFWLSGPDPKRLA